MSEFEIVHAITDWYDGARKGVADLNGQPHYFENYWVENEQFWSDIFLLRLVDDDTFALFTEYWEIWLRWEQAFKEGKTPLETHPCLPEDKARHDELKFNLDQRLITCFETDIKANAEFLYGKQTKVKWKVLL
jgi:hypothetical protein